MGMTQLLDPPHIKGVVIPYHVTPASRLLKVTFDKLESVGFSRSAFGTHSGARLGTMISPSTATALLTFSSFTMERLPPSAGGSNAAAQFTPTKATSSLMSAVSSGRRDFSRDLDAEGGIAALSSRISGLDLSPIQILTTPTTLRSALRTSVVDGVASALDPASRDQSGEEDAESSGVASSLRSASRAPGSESRVSGRDGPSASEASASASRLLPSSADEALRDATLSKLLQSLRKIAGSPAVLASPRSLRGGPGGGDGPPALSPKDEQAHMYNSQLNSQLRAGAASFLSEVGAAFPLIRLAVRKAVTKGSLQVLGPAVLDDFPTTALTEAATALSFQRAGLRVLSTSAQAGAAHAGGRGTRAVAQLGDGFDLYASRLIDDERVIMALSPEDVALGVLPLLPLAPAPLVCVSRTLGCGSLVCGRRSG